MKKKTNHVTLFGPWPPPYGGVAVHIETLYNLLLQNGFTVNVLGYGDFSQAKNIQSITFQEKLWWLTLLKIILYTKSGTVIHNHSGLTTYCENFNLLKSYITVIKLKNLYWVETFHDETLIDRYSQFPKIIRQKYPTLISKAEKIITIGDKLKNFLVKIGVPESKIIVAKSLLPVNKINEVKVPDKIKTFIEKHLPVITTIGVFHPLYDFETILKAFLQLRISHPRSGIIILDAGFSQVEPYKQKVVQLISETGDNALVLRNQPHDIVLKILELSDLFVRGMQAESYGLSRVESILMNTPVVATYSGETHFMTLYEYNNFNDLYLKMKEVLNRKQSEELKEAKKYFKEQANHNLNLIITLYRGLIENYN